MAKYKPLIIIAAAGICAAAGMFAFGEERPAADKINNSSIIIGTYLIDFEALNAENQALAENDARNTNQNKIYYKSELNDGVWYDITDAESVNDITLTNSRVVDNSIIDGLTLTLYFKADGSVVDLSTGETISKQDINGQFDPANMSELSALVKQKDILKELTDSTSKKEVEELDKVFEPIVKVEEDDGGGDGDDTCKELVEGLNALDSIITSSEGRAKGSLTSVKVKKRAELDNYCREVVSERIDTSIEELTKDDKSAHAELIGMLSDAQTELKSNMTNTASQIGAEATDAAGKKQQQLEDEILDAAQNGNTDGAKKSAQTLSVLEAMISGENTDGEAAAELSDEMFKETVSGIESTVSSILDGTHEYYSEGGAGMSSQEVLAQVQTDIADAGQLAKDKAFYKTGSVSSDEYNKILSEDLSTLGLTLSALSGNSGSDELGKQVVSAVGDSADEVLSDAARAKALSVPATAEQKKIDDLESRIDLAYDKYLDALNSGDKSAENAAMEQVKELEEQLGELRADVAKEVEKLVKELFKEKISNSHDEDDTKPGEDDTKPDEDDTTPGEGDTKPGEDGTTPGEDGTKPGEDDTKPGEDGTKPGEDGTKPGGDGTKPGEDGTKPGGDGTKPGGDGTKPDEDNISSNEDKIRELEAQLSVVKGYLSDVDNALLEQALAAMEEMEEAASSGSVSASEKAYDGLKKALINVPSELLGDDVKADMLEYATSLLDGGNSAMAAEDIGDLLDEITEDIIAAKNGDFTLNPSQIGDEPSDGGDESISENLYEYKLVIPLLNIYSDTMSIEKGGTVFLNMKAFAREAGLECYTSGEIFIFRGDDILIELTTKENIAYVGDKLFAPSSQPFFSGDVLYAPIDLVAAGMKLTVETENGTTFMR